MYHHTRWGCRHRRLWRCQTEWRGPNILCPCPIEKTLLIPRQRTTGTYRTPCTHDSLVKVGASSQCTYVPRLGNSRQRILCCFVGAVCLELFLGRCYWLSVLSSCAVPMLPVSVRKYFVHTYALSTPFFSSSHVDLLGELAVLPFVCRMSTRMNSCLRARYKMKLD